MAMASEQVSCKTTMKCNKPFGIMRPYLTYMQLVGLFFRDPEGVGHCEDLEDEPKAASKWCFWKAYAALMVGLNWSTFLSLLLATLIFVGCMDFNELVKMCCIILWMLQNCINASTCYSLCVGNKLFHTIFEHLDTLLVCQRINLHRFRNVVLVVAMVVNVVNQTGWIILSFEIIPGISTLYFFPVLKFMDPYVGEVLQRVWGCAAVLCTPSWTLPTGLFVIISLSVKRMFQLYNSALRTQLKGCDLDVEPLRLQFQDIVHVVEITDRSFGVYIFMMFMNNLCTLSMIIYRLVFYANAAVFSKAIDVFWVVSTISILLIISFVSAWVNVVAHDCAEDLFTVCTDNFSSKRIVQLSLFVKRLSGNSIGFTGCGYFIITKGFILTLVSAFFTYFFLLLQFGSSEEAAHACFCNESHVTSTPAP